MTGRLPEPVEIAAYYAVAEALTDTAKHGAGVMAGCISAGARSRACRRQTGQRGLCRVYDEWRLTFTMSGA